MIRKVWQNSKGEIFETEAEAQESERYKKSGTWFLDYDAKPVSPGLVKDSCIWYAQFVDYDDYLYWSKNVVVNAFDFDVRHEIDMTGIVKFIFDPMSDEFVILDTDKSDCFDEYFERVKQILKKINEP